MTRMLRELARTSKAVGIQHETYQVTPAGFDVVDNMPVLATGESRPLSRRSISALRIGARVQGEAQVQAP
jgi:hypothetical protein